MVALIRGRDSHSGLGPIKSEGTGQARRALQPKRPSNRCQFVKGIVLSKTVVSATAVVLFAVLGAALSGARATAAGVVVPDVTAPAHSQGLSYGDGETATGAGIPLGQPWPYKAIATVPVGWTGALPEGTSTAVGTLPDAPPASSSEHLEALDLVTGTTTEGPAVTQGSVLLTYGPHLYLLGPTRVTAEGAQGPYFLWHVLVRGGSVSLGAVVAVAEPCSYCDTPSGAFQPSGPHAGDLWVLSRDSVQLVQPATGRVLVHTKLAVTDLPSHLAVEPDGRYVDVSAWSSATKLGEAIVMELSTSSGAILKSVNAPSADAGPLLTAVRGGVWISYRSGMAGASDRLEEGSLALTPSPYRTGPMVTKGTGMFAPPAPGVGTMGGARAASFGNVVVLTDVEGASCIGATSAAVLASAQFPLGRSWAPFAARGHTLYGVGYGPSGQDNQLVAVNLPAPCGQV